MEELLAMTIGDVSGAETAAQIDKISGHGKGRFESWHRRKDGTVFNVEISVQLLPGGGRLTAFVRDITSRKQAESYREMSRQVLQILSVPGDLRESIHRVLAAVKTKTGFDAVGIRLQSGDDYPYFAQQGFSTGFVRTEDTLVERGADGGLCRDADGHVRLECTCGLVITGGTDPASPVFTAGGSFWINDSFPLLDLPADQDPRLNPRNRCMHDGYASMALVPIRSGGRIVGLIHVNDRRKGRFTLETIELMEELAAHIGAALMRKRAEEELRETRDYLESLFSYANAPIIVWDAELRITRFNHAFEELTGRSAVEVIGESLELLFPADERRARSLELVTRALSGERWRVVEIPILRTDGEVRTVLWNSATLYADDGTTPVATIAQGQDISERKQAEEELASLNQELERETVALAKANATIALIAATDELTGLASRHHFSEALEKAVSLARRHGSPLALVSLDLDGLKQVNDTLGHEVGDEVLASFAALLAALCRAEDLPGRLGGDEFSLLLPGIDLGGACSVAERVLAAVRSCETLAQQGVTVSAGVVARSPDELPVDLLRRADEALYAAKRSGGDAAAAATG
jgi:diguanylate cyclase (GGDEF)-like protein/PAS domain S-box-containing protein